MSILCVISTIYCASFKFFCMWCLKSILCDEHFLQESQELFQWKINLHLIILVLYLIANFSIDNASSWCVISLSHNIKWDSTEKTFKEKAIFILKWKVVPQAPANRFSQSLKSKPSRNISTINKSLVCECGFSS